MCCCTLSFFPFSLNITSFPVLYLSSTCRSFCPCLSCLDCEAPSFTISLISHSHNYFIPHILFHTRYCVFIVSSSEFRILWWRYLNSPSHAPSSRFSVLRTHSHYSSHLSSHSTPHLPASHHTMPCHAMLNNLLLQFTSLLYFTLYCTAFVCTSHN